MTIGELTDVVLSGVKVSVTRRWVSGSFSRTADLTLFGSISGSYSGGTLEFDGDDTTAIAKAVLIKSTPYALLAPLVALFDAENVPYEFVPAAKK